MNDSNKLDGKDGGNPSTNGGAVLGAASLGFLCWIAAIVYTEYYPEAGEVPMLACLLVSGGAALGALLGALFRVFRLAPKAGLASGIILGSILGFLAARGASSTDSWTSVLSAIFTPMALCGVTGFLVCVKFR